MEKKDFLDLFNVKFSNLKPGRHVFNFKVNDVFFTYFEESMVQKATVNIDVILERETQRMFTLTFIGKGHLDLDCDRCLNALSYPVDLEYKMYLKVVNNKSEQTQDDDIIYVEPDDYKINVANQIYELVSLALPLKVSCEMVQKTCNPEVLRKLENINQKEEGEEIDPRWNKLKELRNN